jgi:hypothetical protein
MEELPIKYVVAGLGFVLGLAFGATAQRTNFCTMGSISDIVFMQDWGRFRAWMLSIAVAILGSQFLHLAGYVDLNKSIYLTPNFGWMGAIIGGALFGFGMSLAGGCGSKTLVRLGAGNLKSLIVAVMIGLVGYMTMRGIFAFPRIRFESIVNVNLTATGLTAQGIPDVIAKLTGLALPNARTAAAAVVAGGLLWFCFRSRTFRASAANVASGLILGAIIVAGWVTTGIVGKDEFEPTPLASLTFVAPVGESMQYLMTFTGATINFGIATVFGVILGAFVMAKATRTFRIEAFADARDLVRHVTGGALMGFGGVTAMGCTIGQGMTGMSTLAMGSVLALGGIILGGVFGMKYLEEGSLGGAAKALFARA